MRPEKQSIVREIEAALGNCEFAFLVDYRGMSVKALADLRMGLAESDAELHVQKNSFIGQAMGDERRTALRDALMGPTGMVTGTGDPTLAAKVLAKSIKNIDLPVIKGGLLDGRVLSAGDVEALAKVPPREVLLSQFVGTVQAPMTSLVGVMHAKVSSLLYVLNAIEEKKKNAA